MDVAIASKALPQHLNAKTDPKTLKVAYIGRLITEEDKTLQ